uniref:Uncharacterized protein n=1 Tax=viral metagenome TaxID=1070528 RepID=A0A6C0EJW8_9ZZZZ
MDTIQKMFIAWVVICVIILILAIVALIISLNNKRKLDRMQK